MLQLSKETFLIGLLVSGIGTGNAYVQSSYIEPGVEPTGIAAVCYSAMPGISTELYTAQECRRELLEQSSSPEHLLHLMGVDGLSRGSYELLVQYINMVGQERFLELPVADALGTGDTHAVRSYLNEIALM